MQCWFLAGPTACGKSAVALQLAERINAEIVALDSMTLYRGMDVGTAKPNLVDRQRVNHHLIDVLDPCDEYSLADYLNAAYAACRQIVARGRIPLFVGGTGLYLRGVLRGVFEGPPADWTIRAQLEEQSKRDGPAGLHDELTRVDAISAGRLHPHDLRRIIRALEVYQLTGQPLSELQQQHARPVERRAKHVYWLSPPRDWLYRRIDARVESMFAMGLIDEVTELRARNAKFSVTARQALGYKEVLDWLESKPEFDVRASHAAVNPIVDASMGELVDLIQTKTRQFAKRQHTWFRNLEECRAIAIGGAESQEMIVDLIIRQVRDTDSPRPTNSLSD